MCKKIVPDQSAPREAGDQTICLLFSVNHSFIRPDFFHKLIYGIFFSDLGSGGWEKKL